MGDTIARFRALASGGIAEKVSRHATVPVLVVV
jgi:nucleotide-binding universal stress UspA family protein